jgi:serpin B
MKRLLYLVTCIVLIAVLLTGCGSTGGNVSFTMDKIDETVVRRNSSFAWEIFRELNKVDEDKNIFISPLSISTALSMTYQGARDTTREAMAEALQYEGIETNTVNQSYKNLLRYLEQADSKVDLSINNSIWIREGEDIKEDFLTGNREFFDAYITELDFSRQDAPNKINNWIDDATKGKIEKMIEGPISPQVVMYLINAIYFKGQWSERFKEENTVSAKFYATEGTPQDIKMMRRTGEVEYARGDDYKAVRLPYGKGKIAMYAILPQEGVLLNDFIAAMDEEKWHKIRKNVAKKEDVILQIPRFKIEYGIKELKDALTALGMGEAFSDRAIFSGIRNGIFISNVLHKAVIEVNEEGSEAAGATVVIMKESAAVEPPTFIANRPFIFIIADEETGTILFLGKYCDPA